MTESEGGLEKVAEVLNWRDSKLFSPAERTALEYAERITYTDRQVDDALFAELKKHFTEAQLVELTAAIALENFRSKFNPTLGVEAQGFCMVPTAGTKKAGRRAVRQKPAGLVGEASFGRPDAAPRRDYGPLGSDRAGVGQDRPHEGDLEFQRRRPETLFDRRPDCETHAAIEQRRREAAMHGAGWIEMLAVGRGGDDDPARGCLDDVVAQRPRHAVQRQRTAHQPLHEFQPAQGGLGVGVHGAVAL